MAALTKQEILEEKKAFESWFEELYDLRINMLFSIDNECYYEGEMNGYWYSWLARAELDKGE